MYVMLLAFLLFFSLAMLNLLLVSVLVKRTSAKECLFFAPYTTNICVEQKPSSYG